MTLLVLEPPAPSVLHLEVISGVAEKGQPKTPLLSGTTPTWEHLTEKRMGLGFVSLVGSPTGAVVFT